MFAKMTFDGKEVLDKPMHFNIWRAPTDNDRKLQLHWMAAYYDHMATRSYSTHFVATENEVRIHSNVSIAATTIQKFINI